MKMFNLYQSRKSNPTISERIRQSSKELQDLMNQLEPCTILSLHLPNLKQSLFHSHTKVVHVAVKQLIRVAKDKLLAEQLSEDLDLVLGLIENLAHKEQRVARDCVMMLLLLSSSPKALQHLLCPDITDVLKTIMTYVAVRILVYELVLQLSINSLQGLEKSHSCGILEDVINDFKMKESYLTAVHYYQLHSLAATSHGYNYLVKFDALECVSKKYPDVTKECMSHLITVVPQDIVPTSSGVVGDQNILVNKESSGEKNVVDKSSVSTSSLKKVLTLPQQSNVTAQVFLGQTISSSNYTAESSCAYTDKCLSVKDFTSSPSSLSSPCDSSDSISNSKKQDDSKELVSDNSSQLERTFTPPLHSPTAFSETEHQLFHQALEKLESSIKNLAPHEVFSHQPDTLHTVLKGIESSNKHTMLLALQILGYASSSSEGKYQLYRLGKKEKCMCLVMKRLMSAITSSPSPEYRANAVKIWYNFTSVHRLNIRKDKIARKWFHLMGKPQEVMKVIVDLCKRSPEQTQITTYQLIQCLAKQEWGQQYIQCNMDFLDMLLSVPQSESIAIRESKDSVLKAFLESPTAIKTLQLQYIERIRSYMSKTKEASVQDTRM